MQASLQPESQRRSLERCSGFPAYILASLDDQGTIVPRSLYATLQRLHGRPGEGLTRREALQLTLMSAAGLLLSNTGCVGGATSTIGRGRRVIVVGAGFAGLAAAYELHSVGYDVAVLESRPRVGGRVLSFDGFVKGKIVEGGGELIGSNHPTWLSYARRFDLEFLPISDDPNSEYPIVLGGRRLTRRESGQLWEEIDDASRLMNGDAGPVKASEPWESAGAKDLDARTAAAWIKSLEISTLARLGLGAQFSANGGVPTERQSYLGKLAQVKAGGLERYWSESEVLRCAGGNQQLARKLAAELGPRLRLATPVREIRWGSQPNVVLDGGERLWADDVVLATPPSTWAKIAFTPPLPQILRPQMGSNTKYLAVVRSRFWLDSGIAADGFSDGDINFTWEATHGQPGDAGVCLVGFSGPPGSEHLRALPRSERLEACLTAMERLWPGFRRVLERHRFMDWPGDPWTGASYSFPAPGEVTTIGPALRAGLPGLHFAGEHTCYGFAGYMEGALYSGVSLARRIAQRDGLRSQLGGALPAQVVS